MMWHEARKQEKKIRGLMVDYKRRAERRKDYYEKIKADPTQFLQLHARACKIHLDPAVAMAADSPATMMPWQGSDDIMIDRFDVRAHLDFIPEVKSDSNEPLSSEERMLNYERYRILVQNNFLGINEDKFLHQLYMEEQFGNLKPNETSIEGKKKSNLSAAIGFNYDDSVDVSKDMNKLDPGKKSDKSYIEPKIVVDKDGIVNRIEELPEEEDANPEIGEDDDDSDSDSDVDIDMTLDVNKVNTQQANELNSCAHMYGMNSNDFFSFLTKDVEEAENLKLAREQEEEKALYSGRKSRRERRAFREKRLMGRKISPPSYAKRSPTHDLSQFSPLHSKSRSPSPPAAEKITFITSFGGENPSTSSTAESVTPKLHSASLNKHVSLRTGHRSRSKSPKAKHSSTSAHETRRVFMRSSRSLSTSPKRSHQRSSEKFQRKRSRSKSRSRSRSPRSFSKKHYKDPSPNFRNQSSSKNQSHGSNSSSHRVSQKSSGNDAAKVPSTSSSSQHPAAPVITRYYGRHKKDSDSSELEVSSEDENNTSANKSTSHQSVSFGNSRGRSKGQSSLRADSSSSKLTPQERLKKKMQALLNRQLKADKRAEKERVQKQAKEQLERAVEIREISIKRRRRERARRHHEYYDSDAKHSDSSSSSSGSRSRSRSKSKSPEKSKHSRSHISEEEEEEEDVKRDHYERVSARDTEPYRPNDRYPRDRYQPDDKYRERYVERDYRHIERDSRNVGRFDRSRNYGDGHSYDQGSRYNAERSNYYKEQPPFNRDDSHSRNSDDEPVSRRSLVNY
nr:PREDICTED: CLK4-associating serine/arginine rich protein-like [Bemisia tabaci]